MFETIKKILKMAEAGPVAVFKIDGKIKSVLVSNKKRYESMLVDYKREFIGVFTSDCPFAVLKENLE